MLSWTLQVGLLLDVLTAAMFAYVGLRVTALRGDGPVRAATKASLVFWYGAAVFMLLDGGYGALVLARGFDEATALVVWVIRRLAFTVGILSYTALLARLRGSTWRGWTPYTIVVGAAIVFMTIYQYPGSVLIRDWSVAIEPRNPTPLLLNLAFGIALFVPPAMQAIGLLSLHSAMPTRTMKYRLHCLVWSTLSFCGLVLIGFVDNNWYWYGLMENRSAFTVATGVLIALRPPIFVRHFWGIRRVRDADELPGRHIAVAPPNPTNEVPQ